MPSRFARLPLFVPLLAGASLRDRVLSCLGALIGIGLTAWLSAWALKAGGYLPVLVAPIGASAVLLFAVPSSPLAQPWSIVGGNMISALVGVAAAHAVPDPALAVAVAVAGAILAMSLCRCLHPPGGAAALTAVIGGPAVIAAGWHFPFVPVAFNSALLVAAGWIFHRFSGHSYPHRPASAGRPLLHREDIDRALADIGETFDIGREDLDDLLSRAEAYAVQRRR
ncbi:HPP family protein [Nostoc sp. 3335mG]|nr:HPP family protein [Nostoc sp. 3335mG]